MTEKTRREVMIENCDFWRSVAGKPEVHFDDAPVFDSNHQEIGSLSLRKMLAQDMQAYKDLLQGNEEWPK